MKVTIYKEKTRVGDRWIVYRREGGRRLRNAFLSKAAAEAEAGRIRAERAQTGTEWINLPPGERSALMDVWKKAKERGIDLGQLLLTATPAQTHGPGPLLQTVIQELIQGKTTGGRSKKYLDSLRVILNQFAKSVGEVPIATIGDAQVEKFLASKAIESRTTLRARISTLFRYALRRHYIGVNPCDSLESVKLAPKPIAIFTPDQTKKAIAWLRKNHPNALPWFILTTFCGLRPEEAEATTKNEISFEEGWVRVEAQTSKVRDRRTVYPKPEAMKLLKKAMAKGGTLPITSITRRRMIRELREVLGFEEWPKDITRHSAASYWVDISERDIARELGTSERMLRAHYICPVTKEQAAEFWKIR